MEKLEIRLFSGSKKIKIGKQISQATGSMSLYSDKPGTYVHIHNRRDELSAFPILVFQRPADYDKNVEIAHDSPVVVHELMQWESITIFF